LPRNLLNFFDIYLQTVACPTPPVFRCSDRYLAWFKFRVNLKIPDTACLNSIMKKRNSVSFLPLSYSFRSVTSSQQRPSQPACAMGHSAAFAVNSVQVAIESMDEARKNALIRLLWWNTSSDMWY